MLVWFRKHGLFIFALCVVFLVGFSVTLNNNKPNPVLKDYKDGVQNHLVWSISGQCYFVRPNDEVTVYLVKVPDCDRSK